MKLWLAALVVWGFSGLSAQSAPKEKETFAPPPPMAQGQSVSLYIGQSIEIPLKAIGRVPTSLRFLIRTPPQHGKLGEIHLTGNKTASVAYTHDEKAGLGPDSFTYAVQGMDGPVSAAAVVNITVSEEPPAFSAVAEVKFPRVWTGETAEQEIVLKNTGGGIMKGKISAQAPWIILSKADYKIGRKEEAKILVQFAPQEEGDYRDKLMFSHDGKAQVTLIGSADAPFEFEPVKKVELSTQGTDTARSGKFLVRNKTDRERTLKITLPPQLVGPKELTLAPGEEKDVALRTTEDFVEALDDSIVLVSGGFREELTLHVFALEPRLKFEPTGGIVFGEIQSNRNYKSSLTLTNTGGDSAHLKTILPKGILIQPDPNAEVLKVGETRNFEVAFESGSPGSYQGFIEITPEGGPAISIPVTARIVRPPTVSDKSPSVPNPRDLNPEPVVEVGKYNGTPVVKDINILKTGKYELELGWKRPGPKALTYVTEVRSIEPGGKQPKVVWTEWHDVKYLEENGLTIARIGRLHPGQALFFRISSVDETGKRSQPSETIRLFTPPGPKINWLWYLTLLLVAAAIANHFFRVRRQRRAAALADEARLAQIEGK